MAECWVLLSPHCHKRLLFKAVYQTDNHIEKLNAVTWFLWSRILDGSGKVVQVSNIKKKEVLMEVCGLASDRADAVIRCGGKSVFKSNSGCIDSYGLVALFDIQLTIVASLHSLVQCRQTVTQKI